MAGEFQDDLMRRSRVRTVLDGVNPAGFVEMIRSILRLGPELSLP
jgi:hypothetical protein